jgi:hypothetical protein
MAVMKVAGIGATGAAALAVLSLVLTPALAAPNQPTKRPRPAPSLRSGGFTPAVADPGLAAELARRGLTANSFRFTPATGAAARKGPVRVAVRARAATPAQAIRSIGESSATAVTAVTPTAYNLGVSVGWRGLALSGDVAEVKGGPVPGGRRAAEVGVSYSASKFTGRVEVAADRADGVAARVTPLDSGYSVGAAASYRIARNLDVTGGVRYKIQRDRLEPLADQRRDSQAVYVGTAFRF